MSKQQDNKKKQNNKKLLSPTITVIKPCDRKSQVMSSACHCSS